MTELPAGIDHLVFAAPDLRVGVEDVEKLLGVRAAPGGQHPGLGTRNALLALGPTAYLEIIGPDPEQPKPASARPFGIDELSAPRLATWAVKGTDLDYLAGEAERRGLKLGEVQSGNRRRSDGLLLSWKFTNPRAMLAGGIVPFFIDWGETLHPSAAAPPGASLIALRAEHPDADRVEQMLRRLGLELSVKAGPKAALIATIEGRKGLVELS